MNQEILQLKGSEKLEKKITDEQKQFNKMRNNNIKNYLNIHKKIYCNGAGKEKKVALTFDDAPDAYCTPRILDILKKLNVQAAFSIIGVYIEENKALLKRIYKENHAIINHTYMHHDLSLLSKEELREELKKTKELIYRSIGVKTSIMRPPFGNLSDFVIEEIARLNYDILLWSYDTYDWAAESADDILYNMCDSIRPGEIILMHSYENKESTVEALEPLILSIRARGFEIVPIEELLNIKCYH